MFCSTWQSKANTSGTVTWMSPKVLPREDLVNCFTISRFFTEFQCWVPWLINLIAFTLISDLTWVFSFLFIEVVSFPKRMCHAAMICVPTSCRKSHSFVITSPRNSFGCRNIFHHSLSTRWDIKETYKAIKIWFLLYENSNTNSIPLRSKDQYRSIPTIKTLAIPDNTENWEDRDYRYWWGAMVPMSI